jgi:secondary thiamine-phosphate synthase enzyme
MSKKIEASLLNRGLVMTLNPASKVYYSQLKLLTRGCMEFHDCTEAIEEMIQQSSVREGIVHIQSKHTTAAVIINEHEPLVLQDMKRVLERIAPQTDAYLHNDFSIRTVNMTDEEDQNGHSHCKAIFLPVSQMLNVVDGSLDLGTWQRIFLLELDCARNRTLSVMIMGS